MRSTSRLAMAVCLVWACGSAPKIDYYTLAMAPSGRVTTTTNLEVERFRATQALSRPRILIAASATRVEYYATDHWVAEVGDLVQQKLAAEFGPAVAGRRSLVVSGTVLGFEQVDGPAGAEARVELLVEVRDAAHKRYQDPLLESTYRATRAMSRTSASAAVEALSRCVEEIAVAIAADASSL